MMAIMLMNLTAAFAARSGSPFRWTYARIRNVADRFPRRKGARDSIGLFTDTVRSGTSSADRFVEDPVSKEDLPRNNVCSRAC